MKDLEERIVHESFGQISFSRVSSNGGVKFYGSSLKQSNYIELVIGPSEIDRSLSKDWFYERATPLVKIRMTQNQFSELITSMNMGGTPCTIEKIGDKFMEELPYIENRKEYTSRVFKERMKLFGEKLKSMQQKAKTLIAKKTLTKNDQEELIKSIDFITTEVNSNIPYFSDCFQNNMDSMVVEAKMEIEAAISHKIHSAGLEALTGKSTLNLEE